MPTIDEIFDTMPAEASTAYEELIIDEQSRAIIIPDAEKIFGVESDAHAERKHFRCPRYVGDRLDLAGCFLRVNYRNANGEVDSYLIEDVAVDGTDVTFSWELKKKVTAYKGRVQFVVCAIMGTGLPEWNTTLASGNVLEGLEPDSSTVEAETADVIAQLLAMVTAQTAAVEAVGAAQCAEVERVGENTTAEAKAAVEAKGAAVVASIPEEYTALSATVDKLTRDRAAAIVCEAEGETIQVNDASADHIVGLRVFGKSTQDGTPTPEAPVEIVSAKAPVVTVCGKNMWDHGNDQIDMLNAQGWGNPVWLNDAVVSVLRPNTTYTLSFDVTCLNHPEYDSLFSSHCGFVLYSSKPGAVPTVMARHEGDMLVIGKKLRVVNTFTTPSDVTNPEMNYEILRYTQRFLKADGNAVFATVRFENVLLEINDAATDYEAFTKQNLVTNYTLPGIPVTSGGNYTDANGQQWIADEVDLARGVYVQRVELKTFTLYKSPYEFTPLGYRYQHHAGNNFTPGNVCLCRTLPYNPNVGTDVETTDGVRLNNSAGYIIAQYTDAEGTAETIDLDILYILATPIETPLSTEEIEAYKALLANKPTTTVLNDAEAWMALEYAADPKLYIDNKIAALLAAN